MQKTINIINRLVDRFASISAVFLMLSLLLLSISQIVLRNIFSIHFNIIGEITRQIVLWLTFIGAILTSLRGKHIGIDILPRLLKKRNLIILNLVLMISASIICFLLAFYSVSFLKMEIEFESTIGNLFPSWMSQIIIPLGFFFLGITFLLKLFEKPEGN